MLIANLIYMSSISVYTFPFYVIIYWLTVGDSNANKQLELKMQNLRAHLWENGPVFTYIESLIYYRYSNIKY